MYLSILACAGIAYRILGKEILKGERRSEIILMD